MNQDERQLSDLRQLQPLVAYPREGLEVELKGWLDMGEPENAASLAKAILALANHGGGYVLIGFAEGGGTWHPDEPNRPGNLHAYDQDLVNGLISRYAEPAFHCEVHQVPHPQTQAVHPVVVVPPGPVPIRAKRGSASERQIKKDSYYIRRPGPKSESPQSGQEWDALLRRCVLSDRDRLLEDLRRLLEGRAFAQTEPEPTAEEQLEAWAEASRARWAQLVAEHNAERRYEHGVVSYAYLLEGDLRRPVQAELVEVLERVKGRETGWPAWLVIRGDREVAPRPVDGMVEALFLDTMFGDPSHSDYWRVSPDSRLYLLRGYEEDSEPDRRPAGSAFDFTIPIWRVGEALLHAERLARELGDPEAMIHFRASWEGLEGRALLSLWARRLSPHNRIARQDVVTSNVTATANQVTSALVDLVQEVLTPLYGAFDFFDMPRRTIEEELTQMREGRH